MPPTTETLRAKVAAARQAGDCQEAQRLCRDILRIHPKDPDAAYHLGALALLGGDAAAASAFFATAYQADSKNFLYRAAYINALHAARQMKRAIPLAQESISARSISAGCKANKSEHGGTDPLSSTVTITVAPAKNSSFAQKWAQKKRAKETRKKQLPQNTSGPPQSAEQELADLFQLGRFDEMAERARRLTRGYPTHPLGWRGQGAALTRLGRPLEALKPLRTAAQLSPDDAEAHYNLGVTLQFAGRPEEALASFDQAIALWPGFFAAYLNLGNVLQQLGRFEASIKMYDRAIVMKPDFAEAYFNRGRAQEALHQFNAAIESFDRAIALKANYPDAHCSRGNVLQALNRPAEARASYDQVLSLQSDHSDAYYNRANVFLDLQQYDQAIDDYDKAIEFRPNHQQALSNRGVALQSVKKLGEALASYDRGLALNPDNPEINFVRSLLLLLLGRFDEGFCEHEWRKLKAEPGGNRLYDQPLWLGDECLAGKTILVHHEAGLGDTIQFCRYLKLLTRDGTRVLFATQPALRKLLGPLDERIEIVSENDSTLVFDYHCPLMSLPLACRTRLETIPTEIPYLSAEPARVEKWRRKIGRNGFKIGICWQGGTSKIDFGRSFPLTNFDRLSRLPNVRLISLHKGAGQDQLQSLPDSMRVETLGDEFDQGPDAFLDSAAAIQCCDLIITSDTAIAHLAGALGARTWVALKYIPDWRWLLDRADSPWYPSLELFRQSAPNDWNSVFQEIEKRLSDISRIDAAKCFLHRAKEPEARQNDSLGGDAQSISDDNA